MKNIENLVVNGLVTFVSVSVGYTTRDIHYKWKHGPGRSVFIEPEVQLPQFKVKGHRQIEKTIETSTGNKLNMQIPTP